MSKKQFAQDVQEGLSAQPKYLPSKYFYDEQGDKLFQDIMALPEYYPTNAEYEIFDIHKEKIRSVFQEDHSFFDLIELGAGDGYKTKLLLKHFLDREIDFKYFPVDISANVLNLLATKMQSEFPTLDFETLTGDYFTALHDLSLHDQSRKVVMFLGGNIGNFKFGQARDFLQHIRENLNPGDLLMIGIDLKKDPFKILAAYNDSQGVTRKFNLNLLERINRDLGGNFRVSDFEHFPTYDPVSGECRSYLISKKEQDVYIEALDRTFSFNAVEPVFTEVSKKYALPELEDLARESGFEVVEHLFDSRRLFTDTIWKVQ